MTLRKIILIALLLWGITAPVLFSFDTLRIEAALDTVFHQMTGFVAYKIPAEPSSGTIEFQLFPNVYSSDSTPYMRRSPFGAQDYPGARRFGQIIVDSVLLGGMNLTANLKVEYTKGEVALPKGHKSAGGVFKIFFQTMIPSQGDRLTHRGREYLLDGWYPSPARLLPDKIWYNPYYGGFSELVGDYFYFDVNLSLPAGYVVASAAPPTRDSTDDSGRVVNFFFGPAHDFALAVSPYFRTDSLEIGGTRLRLFYHNNEAATLEEIKDVSEKTLRYMNDRVGPYQYDYLNVVLTDISMAGGIELPGLVVLHSGAANLVFGRMFRAVVVHEIVHQWFYGMIGSNQVDNPWMDEAVSEFFTSEVLEEYWGREANLLDFAGFKLSDRNLRRFTAQFGGDGIIIAQPSYQFLNDLDYFSSNYARGGLAIETMDKLLGDSLSDRFWKEYFRRFLFKHPSESDFLNLLGEFGGARLKDFLDKILYNDYNLNISLSNLRNERLDTSAVRIELSFRKTGGLDFPIDYWVYLSNGDTLKGVWDTQSGAEEVVVLAESYAVGAVLDPEDKFAADRDRLDNSLLLTGSSRPAMRLSSGLLFLLESLLSAVAGL